MFSNRESVMREAPVERGSVKRNFCWRTIRLWFEKAHAIRIVRVIGVCALQWGMYRDLQTRLANIPVA